MRTIRVCVLSICLLGSTLVATGTFNNMYQKTRNGMQNHKLECAFVGGALTTATVNYFFGAKIKNFFKQAYNKVASFFIKRPLYNIDEIQRKIIYKVEEIKTKTDDNKILKENL